MIQDQDVETRDVDIQKALDEASYRTQIKYLFENSKFYREKLSDYKDASEVGGLDNIHNLPLTEKDALRKTQEDFPPFGAHLAADPEKIVRVYSTSGTSGVPLIISLSKKDLSLWATNTARSFAAAGIKPGQRIVSSFNAGPFVAGASYDGLLKLGATVIPIGTGDTERLIGQIQRLGATGIVCTPSYVLYIIEWCKERDIDPASLGIKNILTAGEPGGGDPLFRERVEATFGCAVREVMGTGDISTSIWGECEVGNGMHFSARDNVYAELIDPVSLEPVPWEAGAEGELVYTSLQREAMPLLRMRSRDHVKVLSSGQCSCGRTTPTIRCVGRTDDMLIVRGVNIFPTAIQSALSKFSAFINPDFFQIKPNAIGVSQEPPLPIDVELAEGVSEVPSGLEAEIKDHIRQKLVVTIDVNILPQGSLPRTSYKRKLVNYENAET